MKETGNAKYGVAERATERADGADGRGRKKPRAR